MERVLIIGCSGAGKSTLARQMGRLLDLPVIHLDREYWQPGWTPRVNEEFDEIVEELIARPRWIIDGNYGRTLERRLARADTVIHLDFPRWRCLYRICKRVLLNVKFGQDRPDMPAGCGEQWDWEFIEWVWKFGLEVRPMNMEQLEEWRNQIEVITLKTPCDVERFFRSDFNRPAT